VDTVLKYKLTQEFSRFYQDLVTFLLAVAASNIFADGKKQI